MCCHAGEERGGEGRVAVAGRGSRSEPGALCSAILPGVVCVKAAI